MINVMKEVTIRMYINVWKNSPTVNELHLLHSRSCFVI